MKLPPVLALYHLADPTFKLLSFPGITALVASVGAVFTAVAKFGPAQSEARKIARNIADRFHLRRVTTPAIVPDLGKDLHAVHIDRPRLMAQLVQCATRSMTQSECIAWVAGETGFGKSLLVEKFLATPLMTRRGVFVLKVSCTLNLNRNSAPYEKLLDALGGLLKNENEHPHVNRLLRQEAPSWYDDISKPGRSTDLQSSTRRHKLSELTNFFEKLAGDGLFVLFIEDVQWADDSTLNLLIELMSKLSLAHVFVLLTCRRDEATLPEPVAALTNEAQRLGCLETIEVPVFTPAEFEDFLIRKYPILDTLNPGERAHYIEFFDRVSGRSPLFITELLGTPENVAYMASLSSGSGSFAALEVLKRKLPTSMRSVFDRRFGSLSKAQREILEQATFQDVSFDSALLATALKQSPIAIEKELKGLERTFLIERKGRYQLDDKTPNDRYVFRHAQYVDYLRSEILAAHEQNYARQMAEAQERHNFKSLKLSASRLAVLYQIAGLPERQVQYLLLAVEAAVERGAFAESILLADDLLELLATMHQTDSIMRMQIECNLLAGLSSAFLNTYAPDSVRRRYARALELVDTFGIEAFRFRALAGIWLNRLVNASLEEAYDLGSKMRDISLQASNPNAHVDKSEANWAVGVTTYFQGKLEESKRELEAGIANYSIDHHPEYAISYPLDPGVACHYLLGRCLWLMGYPDSGLARTVDAIHLARRVKHNESLAFSWCSKAIVHHLRGEPDQVLQIREDMERELVQKDALRQFTAWPLILNGWAESVLYDSAQGLKQVESGLSQYREQGSQLVLPSFNSVHADCLLRAGDAARAHQVLVSALAESGSQGQHYADSQLIRLKGEATAQLGAADNANESAMRDFREAEALARSQGARGFQLRAATSILEAAAGVDVAPALQALRFLLATFTEGQQTRDYLTAERLISEKASIAGFSG